MKAGDKITTKDGMNLIAVTANGFSPCAGCFFNDGQGKPCTLPERTEEALCWDENKSEFKDLVFIIDEENNRKKMKKQTWKMHFFKGVPCKWDGDRYDEERDNSVFKADLYIAGYSRGCSSALMLLVPYKDKDKDCYSQKIKYQVFMSDIEDIVKKMVKGRIKGSFTWVKKGANYGLKLVKEAV